MATVDLTTMPSDIVTSSAPPADKTTANRPQMHRIRTVRIQQGVSLRTAARHTGVDVRHLRLQEQESTDLRLSDLHKWQKALDVPLPDLLVEPDSSLSRPVMERARMVRIMKTVVAIRERAKSESIQRMAQMLAEQLAEVMPELADVGPWHEFGQRRGLGEYGRVTDHTYSEELLCRSRSA